MYSQLFELHADLLKALSHPRRLEILQLLREEELSVTDIHTMLDLPQANVSQHLKVLRDAGVVVSSKNGKQSHYSVADQKFIAASDLFREILIHRYKDTQLSDEFTLEMSDLVPLVHDPVCGMRVSPKTAAFAHAYHNQKYYFCASGCLKAFKERPTKYVK